MTPHEWLAVIWSVGIFITLNLGMWYLYSESKGD